MTIRNAAAVPVVALALAASAQVSLAGPAGSPSPGKAAAGSTIFLRVEGTVSVEGAPTGKSPVPYKGELVADAGGVPLMRGGRASVYDGRLDLNLFGVVPDSCLSSNSFRPVFSSPADRKTGGQLRVIKRRNVVMDFDALVGPELAGYDCRSGDRPLGEVVSLRFTGRLGKAGLASVPLSAKAPVKLSSGRSGTLRVTVKAAIRRLQAAR